MTTPGQALQLFDGRQQNSAEWVDAAHMHHALLSNHFLDILEDYGHSHGLQQDEGPSFAKRLRTLSTDFRRHVLGALTRHVPQADVRHIQYEPLDTGALAARTATQDAMAHNVAIIINAVLAYPPGRIIARPGILLRGDYATSLLHIPNAPTYVPIAIKRRAVHTDAEDTARLKKGTLDRLQAEMWVWTQLLSHELHEYIPQAGVIGLHPRRKECVTEGARPADGTTFFKTKVWQTAYVNCNHDISARTYALDALTWRTDVKDRGESWLMHASQRNPHAANAIQALASDPPSDKHRPNMKVGPMYDWPWAAAKRTVAEGVRELTLIPGVSNRLATVALQSGLPNDFQHESISAQALQMDSDITRRVLEMCRTGYRGAVVSPKVIGHNRWNWRMLNGGASNSTEGWRKDDARLANWETCAFYVDFELASPDSVHAVRTGGSDVVPDVDEEIATTGVVGAGLDALIFMIGCGRVVNGRWEYQSLTARELSREAERKTICAWLEYMNGVMVGENATAHVYVWGPEQQLLQKAMRRMQAAQKNGMRDMCKMKMVNLLQVVVSGGVVIQGNFSNSIKNVTRALENHGLLHPLNCGSVTWKRRLNSGVDVMAVVLDAVEVMVREQLTCLMDAPGMSSVLEYNESDCLHLAQIASYLRDNH